MSYDFSAAANRRLDYTTVFDPSVGNVSFGVWMRVTTVSTNQYFLNVNDAVGTRAFTLILSGGVVAGTFQWQVSNPLGATVARSGAVLSINTWTHIGAAWDGSNTAANIVLYVNGTSTTHVTDTDGIGALPTGTGSWNVSGRSSDSTLGVTGFLVMPFAYSRILTTAEWLRLGTGVDPRRIPNGLLWAPRMVNYTHDWVTNQAGTLVNAPVVSQLHPTNFSPVAPVELIGVH